MTPVTRPDSEVVPTCILLHDEWRYVGHVVWRQSKRPIELWDPEEKEKLIGMKWELHCKQERRASGFRFHSVSGEVGMWW